MRRTSLVCLLFSLLMLETPSARAGVRSRLEQIFCEQPR